jgi:hypothetical protein
MKHRPRPRTVARREFLCRVAGTGLCLIDSAGGFFRRGVRVGRRSATGNRVGGVEPSRGFESHPLRFSFCLQVKRRDGRRTTRRPRISPGPNLPQPYCNPSAQSLVHRVRQPVSHAGQHDSHLGDTLEKGRNLRETVGIGDEFVRTRGTCTPIPFFVLFFLPT